MCKIYKIKDILEQHIGENNCISSSKIAKLIDINEDDTHSGTRDLIYECAKKFKLPVASNQNGYFLISNDQEYEKYMNNLNSRKAGI